MIISEGKKVTLGKKLPQSPIYSGPGLEAWMPQGEKTKS